MSKSIDALKAAVGPLLCGAVVAGMIVPWGAASLMEDAVATVNGQPIMSNEYQKELEGAIENFKRIAPAMLADKTGVDQLRHKVIDQMVDNELIRQEAEKQKMRIHDREIDNGIAEVKERNFRRDESGKMLPDEEVDSALTAELKKDGLSMEQFRDRIRKQIMIRKTIDQEVRPKVETPDDKAIRAAFDKIGYIIKDDTSVVAGMSEDDAQAYIALGSRIKDLIAERVRISHILLKFPPNASLVEKNRVLERAQALKKRIDAGEDFGELAKKMSEDPQSAAGGGDLGFVVRGWLPPELERIAFSTPVGDVSVPVETKFGFHIVWVREKKAAEKLTFEKAKDDIAQFLYNLRFQVQMDKYVKTLREKAQIEVHLPKDVDASSKEKESAAKK